MADQFSRLRHHTKEAKVRCLIPRWGCAPLGCTPNPRRHLVMVSIHHGRKQERVRVDHSKSITTAGNPTDHAGLTDWGAGRGQGSCFMQTTVKHANEEIEVRLRYVATF